MSTKRVLAVRPENVSSSTSSKGKYLRSELEPSSAQEPSTSQALVIGKAYKRSKSDSLLATQNTKKSKSALKKDDPAFTIFEETESRKSASTAGERQPPEDDEQDENTNSLSDNVEVVYHPEEKCATEPCQDIPYDILKTIAEDRRLALQSALTENEMLYDQLNSLTKENEALSEMAAQADRMAEIIAADAYRDTGVDASTQTDPCPLCPHS